MCRRRLPWHLLWWPGPRSQKQTLNHWELQAKCEVEEGGGEEKPKHEGKKPAFRNLYFSTNTCDCLETWLRKCCERNKKGRSYEGKATEQSRFSAIKSRNKSNKKPEKKQNTRCVGLLGREEVVVVGKHQGGGIKTEQLEKRENVKRKRNQTKQDWISKWKLTPIETHSQDMKSKGPQCSLPAPPAQHILDALIATGRARWTSAEAKPILYKWAWGEEKGC